MIKKIRFKGNGYIDKSIFWGLICAVCFSSFSFGASQDSDLQEPLSELLSKISLPGADTSNPDEFKPLMPVNATRDWFCERISYLKKKKTTLTEKLKNLDDSVPVQNKEVQSKIVTLNTYLKSMLQNPTELFESQQFQQEKKEEVKRTLGEITLQFMQLQKEYEEKKSIIQVELFRVEAELSILKKELKAL